MSAKHIEALRQIQKLVNDALEDAARALPRERPTPRAKPVAPATGGGGGALSFNMNVLAFMNKHARGLSGPQKFTLLTAYLVKGDVNAQVTWQEIDGQWNKMTTLLGSSNAVHANRAKAKGWVEPVKQGTWKLTESWKEAIAK